jgi:glutamate dehydrogenase/leucine dehydrogenase
VWVQRLSTVDGVVVFDIDGAPVSAGGTRLAPDVTEAEVALLARAMTYKFAALGRRIAGAKAGVRATAGERAEAMRRYCDEIRPLVEARVFLTGADLGTSEADFAPLRDEGGTAHPILQRVDGVVFEDVVTGFGVAVAAEAALGSLGGRSVAVEGFGKVGGAVAREVVRRGARVVAVSTIVGCVRDPRGLDVDALWQARADHGDDLVQHVGLPATPPAALFDVEADVLVPGARPGVVDEARARTLGAAAVVPAANVPYTAAGLAVLRGRGIAAHADFVCNAGGVLGYESAATATPAEILTRVESRIGDLVRAAADHPEGPFAGACEQAMGYLATWLEPEAFPAGPALA